MFIKFLSHPNSERELNIAQGVERKITVNYVNEPENIPLCLLKNVFANKMREIITPETRYFT